MAPGANRLVGGCVRCGNRETNKNGQCAYCVWKGDIGPGADLKEMIKKPNGSKQETDTNAKNR